VAVSHAVSQTMIAREGVPAAKVHVIHNGFDWDRMQPRPDGVAEWRRRFGARRIIASVGRIDPIKDLPTLLQAVAIVAKSHPEVVLVIAGSGPARRVSELRDMTRSLGIAEQVVMAGFVEDIFDLLGAADVYAQASLDEACSQTISEALGLGVPLAVTTTGGTPELVGPEYTPLPPRDPRALAGRISELLDDLDRARLAARAKAEAVRRELGAAEMVARYLELYRSVVPARHAIG
jgi:glycosyltransferase involved in cell wall biosynthesis